MRSDYAGKAVRGFVVVFVFTFLSQVFGYLLRLLLARSLTVEEYGLLYAVMALFGLFSVFQFFGLNEGLVHFTSRFVAEKKFSKVKEALFSTIPISFLSSITFGLVFFFISDWLAINYFSTPTASLLVKIYAVSIVLSPVEVIFMALFQGFQKMHFYSLVGFLRSIFLFLFFLTAILLNQGLVVIMLGYVFVYVLSFLIYFPLFITKVFPSFFRIKAHFSVLTLKKFLHYGFPVMLTTAAGSIISYTDTSVITFFLGTASAGLYNVALPTAGLTLFFAGVVASVFFPLFSEMFQKNDFVAFKDLLSRGQVYVLAVLFPLASIILVFPEIVLNVLFGGAYISAAPVLQILTVASVILSLSTLNSTAISGLSRPGINTRFVFVAASLNLVLNVLLVPRLGIIGASLTTLASWLFLFICNSIYLQRIIKLSFPIHKSFGIVVIGSLFLGLTYLIKLLTAHLWIKTTLVVVVGILVYGGLIIGFRIIPWSEIKQILRKSGIPLFRIENP